MSKKHTFLMLGAVLVTFTAYTLLWYFMMGITAQAPSRRTIHCFPGDTVVIYVGKTVTTQVVTEKVGVK